jgi:Fur family transcriptional regulator, ferric uptake regulator
MTRNSDGLLQAFGLRHTETRERILGLFDHTEAALSQADLENRLPVPFDRITVYRTIKTFLEKGLIHKILDDQGILKYALCKENCAEGVHHHEHLHFKCTKCLQTSCLPNSHIPKLELPAGYVKTEINILVQGQCPKCQ